MQKSLLFELIDSLGPSERTEAAAWLASPVHNSRPALSSLFSILDEWSNLAIAPERERVWKELFPQKNYDDQQLRLLSSYLLHHLEEWMAWRYAKQDPSETERRILRSYQKRGLHRHFDRRSKTYQSRLEKRPFRHPEFYHNQYHLKLAEFRRNSVIRRAQAHNLQELEDALMCKILGERLRQACRSIAHQSVYETDYRLDLLEEMLQLATQSPYSEAPAVAVYHSAYLAQAQPDDEKAFRTFRSMIFRFFEQFPPLEMRNLLLLAINAGIRKINDGQRDYLSEVLDLYRKGLEGDLLFDQGHLTPFTYNNISVIAITQGELNWTETFLDQYRNRLEQKHRRPLFALNAARLAYAREDLTTALLHLQEADHRDFIHGMSARVLQMKIYFELQENEALSAHLKNTRAYVNRRPHLGYHERNYKNILELTEQLLKRQPLTRKDKELMRQYIENKHPLTEREWLMKQLEK